MTPGGFFLQRAQEVENVLLLLYSQSTETFDDPVCLATAALVGIDRLPQIASASVMEEKDALPYTPKRSRSERIRAGASLRDTVRKTFTHVVDQEIGEQVHRGQTAQQDAEKQRR